MLEPYIRGFYVHIFKARHINPFNGISKFLNGIQRTLKILCISVSKYQIPIPMRIPYEILLSI